MQIWNWKKTSENLTKICLGMVLGSILEGFGPVLGHFWALLVGSLAALDSNKPALGPNQPATRPPRRNRARPVRASSCCGAGGLTMYFSKQGISSD